jgi:rod shape-determining protein MreB
MGMFDFLAKKIGVDAGSDNFRLIENDKIIFTDKTILSVDIVTGIVSGIGSLIKMSATNRLIKPVNYAITDFQAFEEYLKNAIIKGFDKTGFFKQSLISYFCIPSAINEVEKRAIRDSAEYSGSKEVFMIQSSVASSINLNLLFEKKNYVLIEFSASKFEITIFSDSIPVLIGSIRLGTNKLNTLIQNYILRTTKNKIEIKKIESVLNKLQETSDNKNELLNSIQIDEIAFDTIINSFVTIANDEVNTVFEALKSNNNYSKILSNGIYITGGGTYYKYVIAKILFGIEINKTFSADPLLDCINGLKKVISDSKLYSDYLMK